MYNALILLLFIQMSFGAPAQLVPRINTIDDNGGFRLEPGDDRYDLTIKQKNGYRTETVNEVAPGVLQVKGQLYLDFDPKGLLTVEYEAGPNGYAAKYNFKTQDDSVVVGYDATLSAQVLKSNTG